MNYKIQAVCRANIIRKHYGLERKVSAQEVATEIKNLKRRGPGNLDDRQMQLASKLNLFAS